MSSTDAPQGDANDSHVPPSKDLQGLAMTIEDAIRKRTGQGIGNLVVVVEADGVTLRGNCTSYFQKQMAQEVVMHVLRVGIPLTNQIEVTKAD